MDFLKWLLQAFFIFGLFWIIRRVQSTKAKANKQHEMIIEHGLVFKLFSVVAIFLGLGIVIIGLVLGGIPLTLEDWIAMIFVFALFTGLGGALFVEAFFSKVFFNTDGIRKQSLWTRNHSIKWDDIWDISHSTFLNWYVIESIQGNKIRVSDMMNGLKSLLEAICFYRPDLFYNENEDEDEEEFDWEE